MASRTGDSDNKVKTQKSPFAGFLSYFYGNFVVLLLGFIQTPIVTRIMSTDEFGRTGMFETAVTIIYIFAILGLDQAYIRFYYTEGVNRAKLLKKCLIPAVLIVSVLSLIYGFNSDFFNDLLFKRSTADITALVIIYTLISVFERFFFLDVRMQQNGKLYSNINITEKVLSILTIVAAWYFLGNDFRVALYALAVPWGITTAFLMIRYAYLYKKGKLQIYPEGQSGNEPEASTGEKTTADVVNGDGEISYRELIKYGLPFIVVLLMEWILSSCDRVALRIWSTFEEMGIYGSAMKIIILLLTFKNTFIAWWSPVAMERFENRPMEENRDFFRKAYDLTQYLCICAAAGLILFRKVIVLILGSDYRNSERMIPFLTLMPIFAMMFEITVQSIKYSKKNIYLNFASLFAIAVNICGNFYLVPRLGGTGAALTTGVSYLIYFAAGSYFSEKCIKIGYSYKKTFIYAVLLLLYCAYASFAKNAAADACFGIALIGFACVLDRYSLGVCFGYIKKVLKR